MMCTWACWNTQEEPFRDNHRTSAPEMLCGLKVQHLGAYTLFLASGRCLCHPLSGSHGCSGWCFKGVIRITVMYPSTSCSWGLVSDPGDEKHGSFTAGRIEIFLNLRIPTIFFPLAHVFFMCITEPLSLCLGQ